MLGRFLKLFGKDEEVWFFEGVCHWGLCGLAQRFQNPSSFPVSSVSLLPEDIKSQLLCQHYACLSSAMLPTIIAIDSTPLKL